MVGRKTRLWLIVSTLLVVSVATAQAEITGTTLQQTAEVSRPGATTTTSIGPQIGDRVVVSGTLRRVGNSPFTRLVLSDASGRDWLIGTDSIALVANKEQQFVKLRGQVLIRRMILANGKELPAQYELLKVQLLKM